MNMLIFSDCLLGGIRIIAEQMGKSETFVNMNIKISVLAT